MYLLCKPAWFSTSTISAPITTVTTSSSSTSSTIVTPSISSGTFSMLNHNSEMEKNKGMSKFSHICSLLTQSKVLNYRYQIFEAFTNNSISFKMTEFPRYESFYWSLNLWIWVVEHQLKPIHYL